METRASLALPSQLIYRACDQLLGPLSLTIAFDGKSLLLTTSQGAAKLSVAVPTSRIPSRDVARILA